jgi:phage repressor protein C with HTH and peptisase S24 domain
MTTSGERFVEVREICGVSITEMAEKAGVGRDTWRRYEAGDLPTGQVLARLREMGFSIDWLLTGEGSVSREREVVRAPGASVRLSDALDGIEMWRDFVFLPRYDVKASAGLGLAIHSEQIVDYLAFKSDWIRDKLGRAVENLILIQANGDSMQPTIMDGDLLLVDTGVSRLRDSAIYVLSNDGELLVKRVERRLKGGIVIKSDNKNYDPEPFDEERSSQIVVVGQVVWHGGKL